ncbi:helix-turn-helix transcriptional regulator [Streptomyces sp. NBC_01423]|uniref:helix-turn-helix transcriptional regulator n=1 Tax=Streptomyces sp. NBC_01423 TaxID=2903860 RepID=UPI002E297649|nr:helix-turn-helix transcriptional regulator [Streptomyces sp. NBC_01423]
MATHHAARADAPGAAKRTHQEPQGQPHEALDPRAELSEFLRTRRDRLKPADVGLTDYSRRRRVPGLRREELAQLAGVSVAYYTRFEQGNARNVSREVVDAISRVLRLSDAEHAHLLELARLKRGPGRRGESPRQQVRPEVRELLTAMEGVPAYVWGRRSDVLAWNQTASAVFGDWAARTPQDRNWARVTFLDPASRDLFTDWDTKARDVVGQLRVWAGVHPEDAQLASLIGELAMKSDGFRKLWASHDVANKTHGTMRLTHPLVGELTLRYETLALQGDRDQYLSTYHAEPGSSSEQALRLLASWGADATRGRSTDSTS